MKESIFTNIFCKSDHGHIYTHAAAANHSEGEDPCPGAPWCGAPYYHLGCTYVSILSQLKPYLHLPCALWTHSVHSHDYRGATGITRIRSELRQVVLQAFSSPQYHLSTTMTCPPPLRHRVSPHTHPVHARHRHIWLQHGDSMVA